MDLTPVLGAGPLTLFASQQGNAVLNRFNELLKSGQVPDEGWPPSLIRLLLALQSSIDCNNLEGVRGVGEREGRVFSSLVWERHFGLAHGMGRSGSLSDMQPKAPGSTVIAKLGNSFALDIVTSIGLTKAEAALVVPMATGMTLRHCLGIFKSCARLLWSRIDQASVVKSIIGFPGKIHTIKHLWCRVRAESYTNLDSFRTLIGDGTETCLIFATTSTFAPRSPDDVVGLAQLCAEKKCPLLINNAYGLQDTSITEAINQALAINPQTVVVQSLDKNFMVPVGGSIILGPKALIDSIASDYPGRASLTPVLDFVITMLEMGKHVYQRLIEERYMTWRRVWRELLNVPGCPLNPCGGIEGKNRISIAIRLENLPKDVGSLLYFRRFTGMRVVTRGVKKDFGRFWLEDWGSHGLSFALPYLAFAVALGCTFGEVASFVDELSKREADATDALLVTGETHSE